MSTNKRNFVEELRFIKLISSKYSVLRCLYPDKRLSFMDLTVRSGVDGGNLSRYLKTLEQEGLVSIETVSENVSRPYSVIYLTSDTKRIIERVIALRGQAAEPTPLPEESYLNEALSFLSDPDARRLAADQIQILTRNAVVPPNSSYFQYLGGHLLDEELDPVRPVLLLSLRSVLRNSSYASRQKIAEKVLSLLRGIMERHSGERSGVLASEILNEFYMDDASYEVLSQEYIKGVVDGSDTVQGLRRRLLERFPDRKIDLRSRLLRVFSESDSMVRERIESEFTSLY